MTAVEFDFDAFLDGLDNASAFSNTSTSPTTTEHDSDSGIAGISPTPTYLDNTVIDFNTLDLPQFNLDDQFFDDQSDEFKLFSSNLFTPTENTTYESLFSGGDLFEQGYQEPLQQIPSPPSKSPDIPSINNVVKLQSCSGTASIGPKCIKLEPKTPSITIIQAAKPSVPLANIPIITVVSNNSNTAPAIKRRRSDSPVNEPPKAQKPPLTINELRLQNRNMSDEALKKHFRMIKNRESASLSRKRRKELMESLDTNVKDLSQENEQLKRENERLKTRIHILEMENKLLKGGSPRQKPLILMGIVLLVVFNVFTLKSFAPTSTDSTNSIALYNQEAAVVPSRTILSARSNTHRSANEHNYESDGTSPNSSPSNIPNYPYIQCVAYINKTHSKRINQDLRSWVQDSNKKQEQSQGTIIPDPKSLTLPSNPVPSESSVSSIQHVTRKVARQTKIQSDSKGQLQPYKTNEPNYDDFVDTINRKNDTLYFVSFNRDHLILPASVQNQTQRPKMSLILPASMANLNKSIHVPPNHVPMIQIDCEVDDTKLVFVKRSHVPLSHQNELFQYYSSFPQASI